MRWVILGSATALLLLKALQEQGWKTNNSRNPLLIKMLPRSFGVYILQYSKIKDAVVIKISHDLRKDLWREHLTRHGWDSFAWRRTNSLEHAEEIARELERKLSERQTV